MHRSKQLFIALTVGLGLTLAVWLLLSPVKIAVAGPPLRSVQAQIVVMPGQSIQAALDSAKAGDTIVIQAGLFTESLTLNKAVSLTGVSSSTTIIRAIAGQRVLTVTGAAISNTVTISGLTFTGGDLTAGSSCEEYCGGAVLINGGAAPLIQKVIISNNRASWGGGIYVATGSLLNLTDVEIISNIAANFGGGAYTRGATTFNGGRFENNRSGNHGGGVRVFGSDLILTNTKFISNTAAGSSSDGGGAAVSGSAMISGGHFERNTAGDNGGGLYAGDLLALIDTDFVGNVATDFGGGALGSEVTSVNGGRFIGNTAGSDGGGLSAQNTVTLNGTTVISNTTGDDGGGVGVLGLATISNGYFEGNVAGDEGGGLRVYDGDLILTNTDFISNTADFGGGALIWDDAALNGGYFERNTAGTSGGGLYASNTMILTDTILANNTATYGGGAIAFGQATITGGRVEHNLAYADGGGLYAKGIDLISTRFTSNTADFGGGLLVELGTSTITDAFFEHNQANTMGGGLYAESLLTLNNSDFISNTANFGGGAIVFSTTVVNGGRFERNAAADEGGGLNGGNDPVIITGTEFLSNTSVSRGGGVAVDHTAIITNARFIGNKVTLNGGEGGGLSSRDTIILRDTDFINNWADLGGGAVTGFIGNPPFFTDNEGLALVDGGYFASNYASRAGGGLAGAKTIVSTNTTFINNFAGQTGGGIGVTEDGTITNGYFEGNQAGDGGGGVMASQLALGSATLTLSNTDFIKNSAKLGGGGVLVNGPATVTGGLFERNSCTNLVSSCTGGGLQAVSGITLKQARFINNSGGVGGGLATGPTQLSGGPILVGSSPVYIANVLFARNFATEGAGMRLDSSDNGAVLHTTIVDTNLNAAPAVLISDGAVNLENNIISNHATGIKQSGGTVSENYNLFFNVTANTAGIVTTGPNSFTGDPKFLNPANYDYRPGADNSQAIDQGTDAGVNVDLEGAIRPLRGGFDIGCYEAPFFPDLTLTKTVTFSGSTVVPGSLLTYTITLTNEGPSEAKDVQVVDRLPDHLLGVDLDQTVTVPASQTHVFTIAASVANDAPVDTPIANTAYITHTCSSTSAQATIFVTNPRLPPNLTLTKTVTFSGPAVVPGSLLTYTITLTNEGPGEAKDVQVVDRLPDYLLGVDLVQTVTVPASQTHVFTIVATVANTAPIDAPIINTAYITHTDGSSYAHAIVFPIAAAPPVNKVYIPIVVKAY